MVGQVKAMVEGRDRRPDLGYFSALRLRDAAENIGRHWKSTSSQTANGDPVIIET